MEQAVSCNRQLIIYSPYVVLNKTGMPLLFKQCGGLRKSRSISGGGTSSYHSMYGRRANSHPKMNIVNKSISLEGESSQSSLVRPFLFNFPKSQPGIKNTVKMKTTDSNWSQVRFHKAESLSGS
jgi:hypothetical protein